MKLHDLDAALEAHSRLSALLPARTHMIRDDTAFLASPAQRRHGPKVGGANRQPVIVGATRYKSMTEAQAKLHVCIHTLREMLKSGKAKFAPKEKRNA